MRLIAPLVGADASVARVRLPGFTLSTFAPREVLRLIAELDDSQADRYHDIWMVVKARHPRRRMVVAEAELTEADLQGPRRYPPLGFLAAKGGENHPERRLARTSHQILD